MINNNQTNNRPSLIQTIGAVLTAGVMWGSANVIIRSLLIEGLNEIFLVTVSYTHLTLPTIYSV